MIIEIILLCSLVLAELAYIVFDILYIVALSKKKPEKTLLVLSSICLCFSIGLVCAKYYIRPFLWYMFIFCSLVDVCLFVLHLHKYLKAAKK